MNTTCYYDSPPAAPTLSKPWITHVMRWGLGCARRWSQHKTWVFYCFNRCLHPHLPLRCSAGARCRVNRQLNCTMWCAHSPLRCFDVGQQGGIWCLWYHCSLKQTHGVQCQCTVLGCTAQLFKRSKQWVSKTLVWHWALQIECKAFTYKCPSLQVNSKCHSLGARAVSIKKLSMLMRGQIFDL